MARARRRDGSDGTGGSGSRRLIAGLRITPQDEALLAVVRPYLAEAGSEGALAYRLWRRGLELTLAEVASLGAPLPRVASDEILASSVMQQLLVCMPLLRRTGKLALLGLASSPLVSPSAMSDTASTSDQDEGASAAVAQFGGSDFF
jgi:hypothetical protein